MSFFPTEYTQTLSEVIREIETDPATYLGAKYMPAIDMPTTSIYLDVLEARGGLTKEHAKGTDPQSTPRRQFHTQQFAPGAYKEFIRFNEIDILNLRQLGMNDMSKRGIRDHLNTNALVLNNRIEARMELLRWQAIFNGTYIYDGKVIDFGRPAANDVSPTVPWGNNDGAGNFTTVNVNANPVSDMRDWIMGGYSTFRKYKIQKIVMNPNTSRMVLENPKVQAMIQYRFASDAAKAYNVNEMFNFLVPGMPEIEIYNGWYQSETVDPVTGLITVGDAQYFIPDGAIFFEAGLPDNNKVGDVCMTLSLANGDIDNPAPGKFIIIDEHLKDHPGNPYIDIFGGFYGGPRLKRAFDVLTATVI